VIFNQGETMNDKEVLNTEITLKLPLGAVNGILAMLAEKPFAQVADLIQAIREQAIPQIPVPTPEVKPEDTPVQ
jgi:hypothetical protein